MGDPFPGVVMAAFNQLVEMARLSHRYAGHHLCPVTQPAGGHGGGAVEV